MHARLDATHAQKSIEFGKRNLKRFRKMGMLMGGVPSEPTLCRIDNQIDDLGMAELMRRMPWDFTKLLRFLRQK